MFQLDMQKAKAWWQDWWRLAAGLSDCAKKTEAPKPKPKEEEEVSNDKDRPKFYFDEESDVCDEVPGKQVVVGVCAMGKKSLSKPMKEILSRLEEFEYLRVVVFREEVILKERVEDWPPCDCLISFHSKGFPLDKAREYAKLRKPFIINNLQMQYQIQDRRKVYSILEKEGIQIPRYAVLDRDSSSASIGELIESEDHVEVNGVIFNKPFVEKPVSAEDHNIYIYYPTSAGGGSQRLFRKIGSRSSVYSPESRVRKTGSFIYEDFMPTDGTDVKVYTVGPDYAHAEARKSPALDGKVERDSEGKEIRYPVILSNDEKLISRKVCLAFKQTVCGFDLLRANGKSFVCDVNGFSFVKNSNKYYDDSAKILGNMILRELAPTLDIPWSVPFQLDDPPIVPTTFGKMMELRCVVAVIRHGDRTPKQKMKVEVRHPKFFEVFEKYDGYRKGHVKLKRPTQLQEILDIARYLLNEIQHSVADPEIEEKQGKLEQLKSVLEMYGHFSGINRKVQMKYQPKGRPRGSSSDDDVPKDPSLVLILKWGGELTPAGRIQAEELGRIFRCMYPGGQGRHIHNGEYAGTQGLGLLRLHSTYRHDLKIYASDEGRVQMTAAAFAKGLLALEGELTPILVQMVKSANTNGLLDNDCDASKYQNIAKARLHELMQQDRDFSAADRELINPCGAISIASAMDFVKNPATCCEKVQDLIQKLMAIVKNKRDDPKCKDAILYHGETWELMHRRWGKIDKDFCTKSKKFDISKIPDIYDCIKYDLQHNQHTLQFEFAEELYTYAKYLADIVIPQEYGLTMPEKLAIGQGICTPLLKKIRADLQRNIEESGEESVNRLNPRYSHGVSSPGRHVRTRLYFTSESHVHSLLTMIRFGDLLNIKNDEQWKRAMEYVSTVSELNYMSQIVIMLYEDPTKDPSSDERFHVELHFSPGVNCCVQKNLPPGPGFRPHSRNESNATSLSPSCQESVEDLSQFEPISREEKIAIERCETISSDGETETASKFLTLQCAEPVITECIELENEAPTDLNAKRAYNMSNLPKKEENRPTPPMAIVNKVGQYDTEEFTELAKDLTARLNRCLEDGEPRSRSFDHPRDISSSQKSQRPKHQSLEAVNSEVPWIIPLPNPSLMCFDNAAKDCNRLSPQAGGFCSQNAFGEVCLLPQFSLPPSTPIHIPKTVPLYLESTNDILPGSPSLKYLQISPENNSGSLNFPEVTFTNLLAVQNKNLAKEAAHVNVEMPKDDFLIINANKKSGSIPSNFVYCDGAFSGRLRKISNVSGVEGDHNSIYSPVAADVDGIEPIIESPEQAKSPCSSASDPIVTVVTVPPDQPVTDQTTLFETPSLAVESEDIFWTDGKKQAPNDEIPTPIPSSNHPASLPSVPSESKPQKPESKSSTPVVPADNPSRHRHSVAGHHTFRQNWAYFQLYGISVGPSGGVFFHSNRNKLLGSSNSLFSTAVISGSSSAPNLRDTIVNNQTISAIEGCGGVPPIRPLETLHNALSLKQLDIFLAKITTASLYRTPAGTPPLHPSTPLPNSASTWSGASSLVSISTSPKMFRSLSTDSSIGLDFKVFGQEKTESENFESVSAGPDLGNVGILLEYDKVAGEDSNLEDFYSIRPGDGEHSFLLHQRSGDSTPVSVSSEFDYGSLGLLPKEFQEMDQREITEMERCFETEEEDDDGERTITKNVAATRESIVGFFKAAED